MKKGVSIYEMEGIVFRKFDVEREMVINGRICFTLFSALLISLFSRKKKIPII